MFHKSLVNATQQDSWTIQTIDLVLYSNVKSFLIIYLTTILPFLKNMNAWENLIRVFVDIFQ